MQQQGTGAAAPAPGQGQQQAQAAAAAAASAQQLAAAASAQQAAAFAAMLPAAAASGAARPTLAMHHALAAINPGLAAAGMLPLAGPNGTFTFAARPGMQQPFFYPAVPQPVPASAPTPSSASGAAGAAGRRLSNRPSRSSSSAAVGKKHCNCKNSRCLKLYCECFASGRYCDGCNCINCHNNREHETTRQAAVEAILERNPNAFRPKIAGGPDSRRSGGARHNKGCNCKKSGCLKKYCECFQAGIVCSEICKCLDCKNFEGSDARDALISPQSDRHGSPAGLRRTSRTISPVPAGPVASAPRTGFSPGSAGAPPLHGLAQLQQAQAAAAVQAAAAAAAAAGPRGLSADQRAAVAREAVREVVKPEVVEKVAMLLMVVSQEESDRRHAAAAGSQQQPGNGGDAAAAAAASGEAGAMDLDVGQQHEQRQGPVQGGAAAAGLDAEGMEVDAAEGKGPASTAAAPATPASDVEGGGEEEGLYEAQERLVLQEFRDTLHMISRVVGEKVEKKAAAAAAAQQQQMLLLPTHTPGSGGGLGLAALPHLRPGGQAGHPGVLMAAATPGQQPQLVLLPQALMAQQLAAASQQLGRAVTLQQTTQGLQAVLKSGEVLPAASAAPLVPALLQQQQQQQQQQSAAEAATAAESDGK